SARQCTARARGRLLPGCDLVVMVAIPLVDTNEALPHERCCRCEPMARHGDYWNRAPLPDTEKLPPTQGKLPKRSVFSPCYRRVCLAAQCPTTKEGEAGNQSRILPSRAHRQDGRHALRSRSCLAQVSEINGGSHE